MLCKRTSQRALGVAGSLVWIDSVTGEQTWAGMANFVATLIGVTVQQLKV